MDQELQEAIEVMEKGTPLLTSREEAALALLIKRASQAERAVEVALSGFPNYVKEAEREFFARGLIVESDYELCPRCGGRKTLRADCSEFPCNFCNRTGRALSDRGKEKLPL